VIQCLSPISGLIIGYGREGTSFVFGVIIPGGSDVDMG
jgi:nucleoside permease NupC